ncbi:MAG: protein-glutamate O-methyltransferase CheR [Thermoflexibacter sp.]|uniref:Chemotaxis protein methyltransferase CheR n=1 Tax=Thermoflexibacter ruber TaxID=1003 RepID=A0A1I2A3R0_9BACT|nr:protein-glutamate O-methyltransferase CheR [Thermoflexibacter ruber]SFE38601.1 chemotaxis protein methyltransferase CheR [Thermoflexibacter ruber]
MDDLSPDIEITELRRLTQVIKDKYDYDFKDYAMSSFKRRIKRVLDLYKFKNVDKLISVLENNADFFDEFVSEITVNVTEMFRDPTFWKILKEQIIPNILLNHNKITIWHAGCSSGEEVVTMCMVLDEMGVLDKAKIIATDIDTAIINKAKNATYPIKNMDVNSKNYARYQGTRSLEYYYKEANGEAIIHKSLLENVSYRKHDLVQGVVFSKFDLILCRNVMIYFNQTLQNHVLNKLHESLFKYGYLAIGSKESLIWCEIANKFIVVNNEEKIYKKVKD